MPISDKVRRGMTEGSWIRRIFEEGARLKQQLGPDKVFDLSIGNPVVEPPAGFRDEMKKLAGAPLPGMHRYMENAGYADTRAAVATELKRETGVPFTQNEIVMTCGAAGALNVVLKTILDPGDEVIVFSPYFVEYLNYIDNHGGVAKVMATDNSFIPDIGRLEDAIGARTKAVLINSPNNPTGVVYSADFLHHLGELLKEKSARHGKQIFLISDEPYRKIIYDGFKYSFIWAHYPNSIAVTSHSKDLALPGERIGYVAVHPDCAACAEVVNGLIYCNRILGFVNAPALMQHIVKHLQSSTVSIADYQKKRDFLYSNLIRMGYLLNKPQGAFYMFPKTPISDDVAFVRELQKWQVLVVPGSGFGAPGYFRLSYCVEDKTLEGALAGFEKVARQYNIG